MELQCQFILPYKCFETILDLYFSLLITYYLKRFYVNFLTFSFETIHFFEIL